MADSKSGEIIKLLDEGVDSKEIITKGYKPGTVYSTQRKWRQKKEGGAKQGEKQNPISNHTPESNTISEIDSDPEIIKLKKEIRVAELQRQLEKAKAPTEIEMLLLSAQEIGDIKRDGCSYQEKGVCTFWEWSSGDEVPKSVGEVVSDNKTWRIKPSSFYCALCDKESQIAIDRLRHDLNQTPLTDIRERFTCECGSKGMVAVSIKCTRCLKESWWGWWPKKQ